MANAELDSRRPNKSIMVTIPGFYVVSIPYIREGYLRVFWFTVFLVCRRICLNANLPMLNFFSCLFGRASDRHETCMKL